MLRTSIVLLACLLAMPAFASQPGQPLDCSDWVLLDPGLSCTEDVPAPCTQQACHVGVRGAVDNSGRVVTVRFYYTGEMCGTAKLARVSIYVLENGVEREVAYTQHRCLSGGITPRVDQVFPAEVNQANDAGDYTFTFDAVNGAVMVPLKVRCIFCDEHPYGDLFLLEGIRGFAPLFDVLQTFTPQSSLGFRSPAMPDGFRAADRYDSYVGDLTRPLDLSQAHPLQCAYPSSPPHVGDYEQITTPVPTPRPGHANYVLTSVSYQGQTRAGRQAIDGHLHGRDASVLPPCVIAETAR